MKRLAILGATGSIGTSTLDVVARHPDRFSVIALTGHRRIDELAAQCLRFAPQYAVTGSAADADLLQARLSGRVQTEVLHGPQALADVASLPEVDAVMAAIVGAAGLAPTLAAARAGKRIFLANKEALVMAGPVFMAEVRQSGAVLLPIDSEHNAIFQSLPAEFLAGNRQGVRRLILTASGGPFRDRDPETLWQVSPEEAVAHPNWSMGRKISVDSATMMNKGLEVIEARWFFDMPPEQIEVVIHPQSVIHSLVDYDDGSVLAQLGNPDMRTPIAHAMAWPERIDSGVTPLDLMAVGRLDFHAPDPRRFPCLGLAFDALRAGGSAPAILNAANEIAVEAFLQGALRFDRIAPLIARVLASIPTTGLDDLDAVMEADRRGRETASDLLVSGTL